MDRYGAMKYLAYPALALLAACAAAPAAAVQSRQNAVRAEIERELGDQLGAAALRELRRAPAAILLRRTVSLPRMIRQPDGTFQPERGGAVGAVRTRTGWVRIIPGERRPFDRLASREIDRLLAQRAFWAEPAFPPVRCTDPGGPNMIIRLGRRERVAVQPCGSEGLTGRLAEIVMNGRVRGWEGAPPEARPQGLRIERLPAEVYRSYRFSSGLYDARNLVIRDAREWLGQWRRITAGRSASPPPVDFEREMLLLSSMGTQRSGGYSVEIERVIDTGEDLEAHVVHRSPGPRCGTTQAITRPLDVVRVPATPRNVRWVVRQEVSDCR